MANAFDAIATERLLIRPYREADIGAAQALLGDPETMAFWPRPFNPEEAADWVRRNIERIGGSIYGRCALVRRADDLIVGDVGVVRAQVAGEERNDLGYILPASTGGRATPLRPRWRCATTTSASSASKRSSPIWPGITAPRSGWPSASGCGGCWSSTTRATAVF